MNSTLDCVTRNKVLQNKTQKSGGSLISQQTAAVLTFIMKTNLKLQRSQLTQKLTTNYPWSSFPYMMCLILESYTSFGLCIWHLYILTVDYFING